MQQIELKKHQIIPINFMKNNRGLILYHSTGSGKTLTALYSMYQFQNDIIIIGPRSSQKIFIDSIKKIGFNPDRVTFYTYTKIRTDLSNNIELLRDKSVILDEAHYLRSQKTGNLFITSALTLAYKVMLLTATPFVNHLTDFAILVNIAKNKTVLPTDKVLFQQVYYSIDDDMDNSKLVREDVLMEKLKNCISYYKMIDDVNYPTSNTFYKEIEMNASQMIEYVNYVHRVIYDNNKIHDTGILHDLLNIDYRVLGKKKKNIFLTATRQISNTVNHDTNSPKIQAIFKYIKKGPYPIIVYSNFLTNGVYTIAELLEKNNITYESITGNSTLDKINSVVNSYNNGEYKVLLLSSAGSESLDLHNTRQIHIMEPHWNEGKIMQVIGRALRYKSHINLPRKQKHVDIYRWISIFPEPIKNLSADQYLRQVAENKEQIWHQFQDIIKKVSIENNQKAGSKYYDKYLKYKNKYMLLKNNIL